MNPTPHSIPSKLPARGLRLSLALCSILLASGCATQGTLLVTNPTRPVVLNLAAAPQSPAEAHLVSIITPEGRGSWKRSAAWDEFSLRLANRASGPLQVEEAVLVTAAGDFLVPGRDPGDLERQGRNWWQNTKASTASQAAAYSLGAFALGPGILLGPVIAAPAYTAGFVGIHRLKARIAAEFQRRRLVLPMTLAPETTVVGSLFFRISPRPKALVLRGNNAGEPFELSFDLADLSEANSRITAGRFPNRG
jgi:hypothetical protein